jgi:DNA-directed RNA polymerase specialized sigma24 family protein
MTSTAYNGFHATRWSLVQQALEQPSDEQLEALGELCGIYWKPLYVFARRFGLAAADAEDAVQGFVAGMLEKDFLARADPARGRLRNFLLTCFKRYLQNQQRERNAEKRSGRYQKVLVDADAGEQSGAWQIVSVETPEQAFNHRWACALLEHSVERLRMEYDQRGQPEVFEMLLPLLAGESVTAEAAQRLGMREGTVRVALSRFKRRFGLIVKEEVQATLMPEDDVNEEMRELMKVLSAC